MIQVLSAKVIPNTKSQKEEKFGCCWLPSSALVSLSKIDTNYLAVIFDSTKLGVQFHGINTSLYHIKIKFSRFSAQLISKMLHQLTEITRKIIFSKGINFDEEYIWEGFIEESDLRRSINDLEEIMMEIKSLVEIKSQLIEVDQ